jgi:hypothetical protein
VGAPAAPASPGRNRTGKCPTAPLLFQAITHSTTEVNFGPSDFLPLHKIDFPAIAEREVAAALVEPFEAVPLPSGSTPVKFLGKPFGRLQHGSHGYLFSNRLRGFGIRHEVLNLSQPGRAASAVSAIARPKYKRTFIAHHRCPSRTSRRHLLVCGRSSGSFHRALRVPNAARPANPLSFSGVFCAWPGAGV